MKKDLSMRFIHLFESNGWKSYRVRIIKGDRHNYLVQKSFAFSRFGGEKKALIAAKKFRDQQIVKLKIKKNPSRNKFGLVGLFIGFSGTIINPQKYFWVAVFNRDGNNIRKTFSIAKYGYKEAFRKAAIVRAEETGEPLQTKIPRKPKYIKD